MQTGMLTALAFLRTSTPTSEQRGILFLADATYSAGLQYSFRCIKDALEVAKDGDQILLLKGIHNGMGYF